MAKYYNESIETASRDKLAAIQSERLVKTVKRVYDNVPAYRKKMDDIGLKPEDIRSVDDLSKLPFTYKQDLRDNYPYGMFACPMRDVVRIHASSGTTGKQTVVGYTENDLDMWAECAARAIVAAGGTPDDIVHVSYGYGLFTGGLGIHAGAQKLGAAVVPASTGNTRRQLQIFKDFGSTILCCTPSYAMYLADSLAEYGITNGDLKLRVGIFGAEPWTPGMRDQIEKKLGIAAHDIYGLSEVAGPGVSFDCECQSGLHINEDNFIPEIIDPETGEVLPYGEQGELVFTCIGYNPGNTAPGCNLGSSRLILSTPRLLLYAGAHRYRKGVECNRQRRKKVRPGHGQGLEGALQCSRCPSRGQRTTLLVDSDRRSRICSDAHGSAKRPVGRKIQR